MHTKVILFATIVAGVALSTALPVADHENGKYQNSVDNKNDGKYHPSNDGKYRPSSRGEGATGGYYDAQGHYVHSSQPYRHVHDNRELGKYTHIPYPYDGGYGPYNGSNIPYMHVDVPYDHNLYTVSNADFKVPEIKLEYGFPDHEPQIDITPNTEYPVVDHSDDLIENGADTTSKSPNAEQ
uniref:Chloride channel protein ClC-Kb n=1 Tax=Zeugodacus cucurbitae TaxID=28588 RepID=A0A0A1XTI0_ZEUCU